MHGNVRLSRYYVYQALPSNKAAISDHKLLTHTTIAQLGISTPTTVSALCEKLENGSMLVSGVTKTMVSDVPTYYTNLTIIRSDPARTTCFAAQAQGKGLWYATYRIADTDPEPWSGWKSIPLATSPKWYEPTLQNGFQKGAVLRYGKDGGGTVFFTGVFSRSTQPLSNEQITQLPAGYRPDRITPFTITSGRGWCTYGYIETNGVVKFSAAVMSGYASDDGLAFNVSFPCAD